MVKGCPCVQVVVDSFSFLVSQFCRFMVYDLWYHVFNRLGTVTTLRNEAMAHLEQFEGFISSGSALYLRVSVIWIAAIWSVWKSRNDKLFKNKD